MLAAGLLVASCMGSGPTTVSHSFTSPSSGAVQTTATVKQDDARFPSTEKRWQAAESPNASDIIATVTAVPNSSADGVSERGGQRVSLRPMNNLDAGDLFDHWGRRHSGLVSEMLSQEAEAGHDISGFRALLEAAREVETETPVPGLYEDDIVAVLGQRHGVTYGRWSGGPADTLSIEFDLEHAPDSMRNDRSFMAALDRAGKMWSRRIDDTWEEWERGYGESKGHLIGDYNSKGREILVGPGGESSTGLVIYVTGVTLGEDAVARGGHRISLPSNIWEPHTGVIAVDNDFFETAGEARLFGTLVHETGHVLGAWLGGYIANNLEWFSEHYGLIASYLDLESGSWTGPHVVAVHGGPAPFQDSDDTQGWHNGERHSSASSFDLVHSGICASVMSYCRHSAAIPAFQPEEIDFAFLADLGMTIREETVRPETYGLAGWMDHAAFTLSVSRELDVSLAEPQPRYFNDDASWQSLDTVDLLWAEADAFGHHSTGHLANSFPLEGTVRYSGGLIGTALEYRGLPPVYGDANLSLGLDTLAGKASFTSLRMLSSGKRYVFGDGSLHYPISVEDNVITANARGASLVADFYGPRHEEIAGTLDDSRAGLLASFGARHDERPAYLDVVAQADHVRGKMYQDGFSEDGDGWNRFRCGAGPACEGRFEWWKPGNDWYDVSASGDMSPRDRVLNWTAGWGDWISEDIFADRGEVRIFRRYAHGTDGGTGRYQRDGLFGVMEYAAFGTGFYRYHDWEWDDGDTWDFHITGTGFQGELAGTLPPGGAIWEGHMVGHQSGLESGEDPFVQGDARVRVSFVRNRVDIDFSDVTSTDFERTLGSFGFGDIPLEFDGTFYGFDQGNVEGAFFGSAHQEVAGMFYKNGHKVMGSFGAVSRE